MTKPTTIMLNSRAAQRVAQGYPWVFRSDLTSPKDCEDMQAGSICAFTNVYGKVLAMGYAHPKIQLMGRVLALGEAVIDQNFFENKFAQALNWRETIFLGEECYRLVHAESDGLGGLVIDRFHDTLVVQINTAGMDALQALWLPALKKVLKPRNIIFKNDSSNRAVEGLEENFGVIEGSIDENGRVKLTENNTQFYADVRDGQKTGWFFDQRPHRAWIAERAKGKTIIDVFCHTGGFGITAGVKGATEVTCVDSSAHALAITLDNASLNKIEDKVTTIEGKAFDVLESLQSSGRKFDIVCVDPPAFVKVRKDMIVGLKGYEKLARMAVRLVKPGGILFYASCSSHPSEQEILQAILAGCEKAKRPASLVYTGTAGADHPMHPQLPETRYLKALAFRVI